MSKKKQAPVSVKAIENFDSSLLETTKAEVKEIIQPTRKERPMTHTVGPDDTLSSIAHLYCPDDMDVDQFVRHLNLLNNRPQISKGMVIKLFGGK